MPVWEIFRTAYGFCFARMGQFFAVAWPFILVLASFHTLLEVMEKDLPSANFGQMIVEAFFAFLWHRNYLLGPDFVRNFGIPKSGSKEEKKHISDLAGKFVWRTVGLMVVLFIVVVSGAVIVGIALPSGPSNGLLKSGFILFGLYMLLGPFFFRILPYFPAIAVDGSGAKVSEMWKLTAGQGIEIWACFTAIFIPLLILAFAASLLLVYGSELLQLSPIVSAAVTYAIMATVGLFTLAVGVSANSEIYRRLTGFDAAAMRQENASNPTPSRRT